MCTFAVVLGACDQSPIVWTTSSHAPLQVAAGETGDDWRLVFGADLRPALAGAPVAPRSPAVGTCAASVVFARLAGEEWFAAWWQPRANGSAALQVARSMDGGATWGAPVTADGRDGSVSGCDRPRPAIAADSATGYVHLAYYLRPEDGAGAGIWFTHSMDQGQMWHAPVGVFYGDDPARASVAAHGDTVAVAYEYPNAGETRVGIAVSRTMGHIFEIRLPVSSSDDGARDPRVAVRGRAIAVAWESRAAGGDLTGRPAVMVDVGELR
jgi:hypothetical protein